MSDQELSPKGRQEVGTWIANRLAIVCGGVSTLVLVPAITGKTIMPMPAVAAVAVAVFLVAVFAGLIKYGTAERIGEALGPKETAND
jgi:hypothetical protein